jgi:hypothetical protein
MVTRRTFLHSAGVGPLATHLLGRTDSADANQAPAQAQAASKPNILFVLMDNLGYGEVGCYGGGDSASQSLLTIDQLSPTLSSWK